MPDTIVALSTGSLPSGVAVIRASGPAVRQGLLALTGKVPEPRQLRLASISNGTNLLDRGLVAFFPAPNSFTGEDCAEYQVHGSPAVVRAVLRALTQADYVRLAEAGEFTRRAFENGRLDLTAVEGLGDLISAETESQRRQALARSTGGIAEMVGRWRDILLDARAEVEAQLDFSDEGDVPDHVSPAVAHALLALRSELTSKLFAIGQGRIVREGLRIALAGAPNAGKSSLLNALARSDLAIVSDQPGTTRDLREVAIDLGGHYMTLLDMAGLRETADAVEAEGVRRARQAIETADLVLWLFAPGQESVPDLPTSAPVWRIATKADIAPPSEHADLSVSILQPEGLKALTERLQAHAAAAGGGGEPILLSHERDRTCLVAALDALDLGLLDSPDLELTAEMLRSVSGALQRLVGTLDAENVLDRLFSSFCIGK